MPTGIEWCDEVWNPVTGCTKISAGCQNCYAERMAKRLRGRYGYPADDPFRVTFHPDKLDQPKRWRNPRRVFVDSMGDLFHEEVAQGWLFHVFDAMADAKQHIFHALTKRPENIQAKLYEGQPRYFSKGDYLPNVHLGTSIENQEMANKRFPHLLRCPAALRFVSFEPLLGPTRTGYLDRVGIQQSRRSPIGWAIIGCETGPNRRPCKLKWVHDLIQQCDAAGVPPFVKQLVINGRVSKDPAEWPQWARRREFPVATGGLTR